VEKTLDGAKGLARYEDLFAKVQNNREAFDVLSAMANRYLDKCGRRYVDMQGLFGFMEKIKL
jgi:DNA polymerase alpha subunit A